MRKLLVLLLVLVLLVTAVAPVFAGGDKVHGDKGEGGVNQNGPCPFGGDSAGENNPWPEPPQVGKG